MLLRLLFYLLVLALTCSPKWQMAARTTGKPITGIFHLWCFVSFDDLFETVSLHIMETDYHEQKQFNTTSLPKNRVEWMTQALSNCWGQHLNLNQVLPIRSKVPRYCGCTHCRVPGHQIRKQTLGNCVTRYRYRSRDETWNAEVSAMSRDTP